MVYNFPKNEYRIIKGKKLQKYICKDCHSTFYNYDYNLCPYCDSVQSGDISDVLYIFADCFSYHNGKPDQFSGYTTIITNDRFDLPDKKNIEYINRQAFNNTTNNYGELMGVLDGLIYFINNYYNEAMCYKKLVVISDSEYTILGLRDRMYGWKANNWRLKDGSPVKNLEIWKKMMEAVNIIKQLKITIEFVHQKGHKGKTITKEENPIIYLQEKCDTLSVELKNKIIESRG